MPLTDEISQAEAKLRSLNDQNAVVAQMQVRLSQDVQSLKKELDDLTAQKEGLQFELDMLTKRIAEKNAERVEELNQRDLKLQQRQERLDWLGQQNTKQREELDAMMSAANDQIRSNAEEKERLDEATNYLNDRGAQLDLKEMEIEAREESFVEREATIKGNEEINLAATGNLKVQKKKLDDLIKENEAAVLVNQAGEENMAQLTNEMNLRIVQWEKSAKELNEKLVAVNQQKIELDERQKFIDGEKVVIAEEKKRLEYGWLSINKLNRDKQLGMDLEALKKS